jgi:hypothetical protein
MILIFPEVDLSCDEADPQWHADGDFTPAYRSDGTTIRHYTWNRPPGMHHDWWDVIREEWEDIVREYEARPGFYESYNFLDSHPAFWEFTPLNDSLPVNHVSWLRHEMRVSTAVDIRVTRCSPEGVIEDEDVLNTVTQVWWECGKIGLYPPNTHWHDCDLEGKAMTYEYAITELARQVHEKYGNDRSIVDAPGWEMA